MQVVELPTFGTDMTVAARIEILSESPLDTLRQEGAGRCFANGTN